MGDCHENRRFSSLMALVPTSISVLGLVHMLVKDAHLLDASGPSKWLYPLDAVVEVSWFGNRGL
jgi:hypothetical protein